MRLRFSPKRCLGSRRGNSGTLATQGGPLQKRFLCSNIRYSMLLPETGPLTKIQTKKMMLGITEWFLSVEFCFARKIYLKGRPFVMRQQRA